jgi:chemosensory pili system protein ChpA (sensor histidine kinase/response regulator)
MATAHARPLILIVEDHADTREMYAEYLGASFDVIEAADGQQALGLLEYRAPAVVITDFSLPGIDGFELIRRIRDNEATAHIPVICLSGHAGRVHEERAREVGCDRVLEKPCLPDRLAEAALEVVRLGRSS